MDPAPAMLDRMDLSAATPGPAPALGIALVAGVLAVAAAAGLLLVRPAASRRAGRSPTDVDEAGFAHDDLPSFREHPPGFPGAPAPAPACVAVPAHTVTGRNPLRSLTAAALVALLLVAAAAAVAYAARRPAGGERAAASSAPSPVPSPATSPIPLPAPMSVPASPSPGQPGAGTLAYLSVPLGRDGLAARLRFGGVLLEQRAVGITVAYPSVSVTSDGRGTALAHLRLETFNCLTAKPPPDPVAAGCVRSVPEYAELPSPALTLTGDGDGVRLAGRFPTYTRPNGTAPIYTGRVYDVAVTARPGAPLDGVESAAEGEFFLGASRAGTVGGPTLNALRRGG